MEPQNIRPDLPSGVVPPSPPVPPTPPTPPIPPSVPPPAPPPAPIGGAFPAGAPGSGQVVTGGFDPTASNLPGTAPLPNTMPSTTPPGVVMGEVDPMAAAGAPSSPPAAKRSLKMLLIIVAAVFVLFGGSAAAYFAVILPNQPANILKKAIVNSLEQQQVSTSGSFEGSPAFGNGVAYRATFSSASDVAAKAVDLNLNITVSGVSFPVEARLVNKNLYFKIGDLSTIAALVNAVSPDTGSLVQSVSGQLSNKWIVVDSTLLQEDGTVKCLLDTNWTLTNADLKLLQQQYAKHPFTNIQSASGDTVNGKAAEKFVLNIDNDKSASFFNDLINNVSVVKNLQKCPGMNSSSPRSATSSLSNHGKTPLTVWVDKSTKRIVQISAHSTNQASQKSNIASSVTVKLHYGNVSVTAPSNAEPALQVFGDIANAAKSNPALSNLLNSTDSGSSTDGTGTPNLLSQ